MSHSYDPFKKKLTISKLALLKKNHSKISMITCYDSAFAKIIDQSPIDIVLVGDSLGNVILGFDNTIPVTMNMMIHHTQAVQRCLKSKILVADMPFGSYVTVEQGCINAAKLIQEGGAHAVKIEGNHEQLTDLLVKSGIPVFAHLGLTPQSIHKIGNYGVQAQDPDSATEMIKIAKNLENAGASALILEMIPANLAKSISEALQIPTIGIGAGQHCDGQVLVLHDMLGFDDKFNPKFLKKYLHLKDSISKALNDYDADVKNNLFPNDTNIYE